MTNDLISRQDAIDAITTWDKFGVDDRSRIVTWHEGLEPYVHLRDVVTAIVGLPSAQPEQRWIPCSERLPEDEQNVLVTYKTTDKIHPCQYHADGSKNPWYSYTDQCRAHMNVVLAWMPLPEPYKGEADGES